MWLFFLLQEIGDELLFSQITNALNVAFSRAKQKLWIVGQRRYTDNVFHWIGNNRIYMLREIGDSCLNKLFAVD